MTNFDAVDFDDVALVFGQEAEFVFVFDEGVVHHFVVNQQVVEVDFHIVTKGVLPDFDIAACRDFDGFGVGFSIFFQFWE